MTQAEETNRLPYCAAPPRTLPVLPAHLPAARQRAIILGRSRWVNGTRLRYAFLGQGSGDAAQRDVVRETFREWADVGIGLSFAEVDEPAEAELRIGFMSGDGSWSYLGRDCLLVPHGERTMNFGWDLRTSYGRSTARHEIGHALGMPHEHQNPHAGIIWDTEAVYRYLGGPPNNWDRDTVHHNVLRKLDPSEVDGSNWDPSSVMEYEFPAGLVVSPAAYQGGIYPPGTISTIDKEQALRWYPTPGDRPVRLEPFRSVSLNLAPADQFDAEIVPDASRSYRIGTFGSADVVLVLFEEVDGEPRYLAGDDDSGEDRNALIHIKLLAGRRYIVRLRMYYAWQSGASALMHW